jgi:vanillate O-demethylase monooxygenase subunit
MTFLKNTWYVAAWEDELSAGTLFARTIVDCPVVLYRKSDYAPVALYDACAHRFAPLSKGRIENDSIRCGYHGLVYDCSGVCIKNPHGAASQSIRVRAYPVIERHALIWIWMGDPLIADETLIPDLSFIQNSPQHSLSRGYTSVAADHRLLVDNILDLSHSDYLHPDTLGGGSFSRAKVHIEDRDGGIYVQWLAFNDTPLPIWAPLLPDPKGLADSWTDVHWHPSGVMPLNGGTTVAGGAREDGIITKNVHIMTPETAGRTHYFFANARNYRVDDADYNYQMAVALRSAFEGEDKPMVESQQLRIGSGDFEKLRPALLRTDQASTRARRRFDQLLHEEAIGRVSRQEPNRA